MDDGVEGYMSPHTNRQGIPVCHRGNVCGVMNSDQFFATNSSKISGAGRDRLMQFFQQAAATSYIMVPCGLWAGLFVHIFCPPRHACR